MHDTGRADASLPGVPAMTKEARALRELVHECGIFRVAERQDRGLGRG